MNRRATSLLLAAGLVGAGVFVASHRGSPLEATPSKAASTAQPRLEPAASFEPNRGQGPGDVLFLSNAPGREVRLTRQGARFRVSVGEARTPVDIELTMVSASEGARLQG